MDDSLQNALRSASAPLWVVGGAVRDRLLGLASRDVDIAVAGSVEALGRSLADGLNGHFFVLHPASQTARVVLPDGSWLDLVGLPDGLPPDLQRRDFTVNAMALSVPDYLNAGPAGAPPTGLVDPTGGWADLQAGVLRAPSASAFTEDPLRALRGLRFTHTLPPSPSGAPFRPDDDTRARMRAHAPALKRVSAERVRDEWLATMAGPRAAAAVEDAADLGFLDVILPEWRAMRGVSQNGYHHLDVWEHTLDVMRQMDALITGGGPAPIPADLLQRVREYLDETPTPVHTRRALMRQGILLHDAGKPSARTQDEDGRVRFVGHEWVSEEMARRWAADFRLSGRERGFLSALVGLHMRPGGLMSSDVTPRAVQRFFRDANSAAPALLLLNAADRLAARGPWTSDAEVAEQVEGSWQLLRRFYTMQDTVALPLPLSGRDVMAAFRLPPGPDIGRIIQSLRDLHGAAPFADRESALEAARAFLPGAPPDGPDAAGAGDEIPTNQVSAPQPRQ